VARSELAPLKPQVYLDPRPAEHFDRFHARARSRGPDWTYPLLRVLCVPICRGLYRLRDEGAANVPHAGPAILAPNHFSGMDHFLIGFPIARPVRFMAKSQLFKGRFLEWALPRLGAFPVRRGQRDGEALSTARSILSQSGLLVMYVEGGRSRSGQIGDRARPGIGRLSLETGAPIVPVAIHGSERARNWKRLEFPSITVRYGEPLEFSVQSDPPRERQQEVADAVLARVRSLHAELSAGDRGG
jgi:1-acyl-sn-glycerol-3-phosphate acyltransferase